MISADTRGSLYAILSGFLYGFIGYFGVSAINGNLSATNMLFWRFLISSSVLLLIMIPQLKKITDSYKAMTIAYLTGLGFYGVSTMLYFLASHYIGSGLAMVIFFIYPVIIMLLNYFLYGLNIPRIYYLATFIIFIGMILLVDTKHIAIDLMGILLAIVSSFFYACYIIFSKNNQISPNVSTLMVCLGCMTTCFIVAVLDHSFVIPKSLNVWANLLGIGVIATVLPILLFLYSLKYINSEKASLLSVLEPVFVVIFGVFLLGEVVQKWSAFGVILVLLGALMTLFSHRIAQLWARKVQLFGRAEPSQ